MNTCLPEPSSCVSKLVANGFTYFFAGGTTNADPGRGMLRYNSITQSLATFIYIDLTSARGSDLTSYIENIANSTNPVLGQIYILKACDPSKGHVFNVMSVTINSDYASIAVTLVEEVGGPQPLQFGDLVTFSFVQAGNAGTSGSDIAPNNPTNNTFVGSGQIPELPGVSASNGQTATCTFGTIGMLFMVSTVSGKYAICGTCYGSSSISSIDDPEGLITFNSLGVGIYISKLTNSFMVSFKNQTGGSETILVQAINSPITTATSWA